jgi:hypothetical protein
MDTQVTYSARASLVALGLQIHHMGIWATIRAYVHIKQKKRKHDPLDKLLDAFINILAGGHGLSEINTRVRPDPAVQHAFGRVGCADQSSTSRTLNACTSENVQQFRQALQAILRQHSRSYRHDYTQHWQLWDIDLTGLTAGRLGEGVTKGYFAKRKSKRGRQLGRLLATLYDEIIVDHLHPGKQQLNQGLRALVLEAEQTLEIDENKRKNTLIRIDGGGGVEADINWMLQRHYHILIKIKSWHRAAKLAPSVDQWYADPKVVDRQVGWVREPFVYLQPTRQLAIRTPRPKGGWHYQVLVFTLSDAMLFELCQRPMPDAPADLDILLAALHAYDLRDGGLETQNKGDKQGLGLNKRNKRRFCAQEMLVLLAQLAHDCLIWTRDNLSAVAPEFEHYGMLRMVRDVLQIDGTMHWDATGNIANVDLNTQHPLATAVEHAIILGNLSVNLRKN